MAKNKNPFKEAHDEFCKKLKNNLKTLKLNPTKVNIALPGGGDIDLACYEPDAKALIYIEVKAGDNAKDQFNKFLSKRKSDVKHLKENTFEKETIEQEKHLFFAPKIFDKTIKELNKKKSLEHDNENIFVFRQLNDFIDLSKQVLPEYAKREFLRNIGVIPHKSEQIKVSAIESKILRGKAKMYQFACSAKKLAKFASVPRRSENNKNTRNYRRLVKGNRLKTIAKNHIDKGGDFVNNVILKLEEENINFESYEDTLKKHFQGYPQKSKTNPQVQTGLLNIKMNYNSAFIIDGQHRLLSYLLSKKDGLIKVSGLVIDNPIEEAGYFVDINSKASQVNQNLIWDLHGDLSPKEDNGMISNIFKEAHNSNCPVFANKLNIPSLPKKGKPFSYAGLCRTFQDDLGFKNSKRLWNQKNPFYHKTFDHKPPAQKITSFFTNVFKDFDETKFNKFFTDGVLAVYLKICKFYHLHKGPKRKIIELLQKYVNNLEEEDIQARRGLANAADKKIHFETIVLDIQLQYPTFGPEIKSPGITAQVENLEKKLRDWVVGKIVEKESKMDWFENTFAQKLPKWIERNVKKYGSSRPMEDFLDWGQVKDLITKEKGFRFWDEVFKEGVTLRFHNKNDIETAMENIYCFRSPGSHGSPIPQGKLNQTFLKDAREDIKKLHQIIEKNPIEDQDEVAGVLKDFNTRMLKTTKSKNN